MSVMIRNAEQLAQAKEDYEALRAAWRKAMLAQSYTQGTDQLTRASLRELQVQMEEYKAAIDAYEMHGSTQTRRAVRIVPVK